MIHFIRSRNELLLKQQATQAFMAFLAMLLVWETFGPVLIVLLFVSLSWVFWSSEVVACCSLGD